MKLKKKSVGRGGVQWGAVPPSPPTPNPYSNNFDFDTQRRTFHIMGYAVDPSTAGGSSSEKPK